MKTRSWAEPYKIKMVEPLSLTTREERMNHICEAGYNTFLLKSKHVYIDLLTDSGTSAMSDRQWAGLMLGDEAYAGSENFYHMEDTIRRYYGYQYVVPTHQGRGAEHILSKIMIQSGDYIPGNMYFTTTRLHQELAGGKFVDIIVDEAHDPQSEFRFKGNCDLNKLEGLINKVGAQRIPYVCIATTVNMAGGQPIALENLRALRALTQQHNVKIVHDMTRVAENAFMIQQHEPGHAHKSVAEIVKEICSLTDAATMSSKKDALVSMGGFLAVNDFDVYEKARNMVVVYEGLHTYGGMSGRDMEALSIGITESVEDNHIRARVGQVEYLGKLLFDAGIPIVRPIGTHGVFLDATRFLEHVPQDLFPAQSLSAALYIDSGVRSMERGIVSAGRDSETGENHRPKLELVRLTIPRRVYTQAHMDVVAESVASVYEDRKQIKGLRMTYEPDYLRFFLPDLNPLRERSCMTDIEKIERIKVLKRAKNAVILAHYYQEPVIQELSDHVGDSLALSIRAKQTEADIIVFAGVRFMAETAKIISPDKKVLLPDADAGCSLVDSCTADLFKAYKKEHPDHYCVTYINSSVKVKAMSDIICTSSNAEDIIRQAPAGRPVLFAPDRNLGAYLQNKTGRKLDLWDGRCEVHHEFSESKILALMQKYPEAELIAHPESQESVLSRAVLIGSTQKLLDYVAISPAMTFIVATEAGILHKMKLACPEKHLIPAPLHADNACGCSECPYMKMNTLDKLMHCLETESPEVTISMEILQKAALPLTRMLNFRAN